MIRGRGEMGKDDRRQRKDDRRQRAEDSEETLEVGGALRFRLEAAAFASWLRRAKEDRGRGRFIRELEN